LDEPAAAVPAIEIPAEQADQRISSRPGADHRARNEHASIHYRQIKNLEVRKRAGQDRRNGCAARDSNPEPADYRAVRPGIGGQSSIVVTTWADGAGGCSVVVVVGGCCPSIRMGFRMG